MTNARFLVHMDAGDKEVVWWAESADIPGLSVAADTLTELRRLVFESVEVQVGATAEVTMHLAGLEAPASRTTPVRTETELPASLPASHAANVADFILSQYAA